MHLQIADHRQPRRHSRVHQPDSPAPRSPDGSSPSRPAPPPAYRARRAAADPRPPETQSPPPAHGYRHAPPFIVLSARRHPRQRHRRKHRRSLGVRSSNLPPANRSIRHGQLSCTKYASSSVVGRNSSGKSNRFIGPPRIHQHPRRIHQIVLLEHQSSSCQVSRNQPASVSPPLYNNPVRPSPLRLTALPQAHQIRKQPKRPRHTLRQLPVKRKRQ